MPRPPVTTDWVVCKALHKLTPRGKKLPTAEQIAKSMKLTVFQITARLKGMEKRGLLARADTKIGGKWVWKLTDSGTKMASGKEPPPEEIQTPKKDSARKSTKKKTKTAKKSASGAPPPTVPDDSKVPRVTSMKKSDGWDHRNGWGSTAETRAEVFISPDGEEYVKAHSMEKANLIREFPDTPGLSPMRLVLLEGSVAMRHAAKAEKKEEEKKEAKRQKKSSSVSKALDEAVKRGEKKAAKRKKTTRRK